MYKVFNGLAILGVFFAFAAVISKYGLGRYLSDQSTIKGDSDRSVLGAYLIVFGYVNITIGVILYHIEKRQVKYLIVPLILITAYSFSFWGRHPIANGLIQLLFSYFILNRSFSKSIRKNWRVIARYVYATTFLIFLAFFILSWSIKFRLQEFEGAYDPFASEKTVQWVEEISPVFGGYQSLRISYAYLGASVPTLDYWLSKDSEFLLGQASFPYLYRILVKFGFWSEDIIRGDRALGGLMQLPGLIGYIYMDFGMFGIILISLYLGYICKRLYNKALTLNFSAIMLLPHLYILIINSPLISATAHSVFFYTIIASIVIVIKLKQSR